jgi:hypothetical protein
MAVDSADKDDLSFKEHLPNAWILARRQTRVLKHTTGFVH